MECRRTPPPFLFKPPSRSESACLACSAGFSFFRWTQRLFRGITVLFLVSSAFTLAKVIRDQQEAATVRVRLDEARMEKLLAEHNPFTAVS